MKKKTKQIQSLLVRVLLCFLPIAWISVLFTPLTVHASAILTSLFYDTTHIANSLIINQTTFAIIEACVASFAYYFLWLLVFLTKDLTVKQRIKILGFCWASLFAVNVLRIVGLIVIAQEMGWQAFHAVHMVLWKFVSGIFVAIIWIVAVKKYNIHSIPVYDDLMWLVKKSYFAKRR